MKFNEGSTPDQSGSPPSVKPFDKQQPGRGSRHSRRLKESNAYKAKSGLLIICRYFGVVKGGHLLLTELASR